MHPEGGHGYYSCQRAKKGHNRHAQNNLTIWERGRFQYPRSTLPWVGTPVQSSQHRLVKEMFAEHGLEVSSSIEADQEATMIEMVRQGVGLCMMRDNLAQAAAARGELLIWEGVQRPCLLSFIYPERAASDPVMEALLAILHDMWQPLM